MSDSESESDDIDYCQKNHPTIDITIEEHFRIFKEPLEEEEDGFNATKCLDCGEIYNNTYQVHCCCKCQKCGEPYEDPYVQHKC